MIETIDRELPQLFQIVVLENWPYLCGLFLESPAPREPLRSSTVSEASLARGGAKSGAGVRKYGQTPYQDSGFQSQQRP